WSSVIFYLLLCIPSTMQRSVPQIRYKLVVQQIFAEPLCSFDQLRRKHLTHSFQPLLLALHLLTQWLENSNPTPYQASLTPLYAQYLFLSPALQRMKSYERQDV